MNPENTNRDVASQPPQLCESLGFETQISRDIFTLTPWRAPVMDTSLLLDPIMVPVTNKHYTFNLPYEDMGCLLREV